MFIRASVLPAAMALHTLQVYYSQWAFLIVAMSISNCRRGEKLQSKGKRVLILVWDNASWHISKYVRNWVREHNRKVTMLGQGVRIWVCPLPTKSPWLNPIEPKWVHGKRRVVEPSRKLSPAELEEQVYSALDCSSEPHLTLSNNVV